MKRSWKNCFTPLTLITPGDSTDTHNSQYTASEDVSVTIEDNRGAIRIGNNMTLVNLSGNDPE